MRRLLLVLVPFLTLRCTGEGALSTRAAGARDPAVHFFVDGAEVTRVFLPDEVHVRLTGFPPSSRVTLRASMPGYASHAVLRADAAGAIDVAAEAPEGGTYQGADADGLFWSMRAASPRSAGPGADLDVAFAAEVSGVVVAEATLARHATADGLTEIPVHDAGLDGVFVTPAGPGPHPALLTFGGSEGGIDVGLGYARLYASLGYSCLGLAYFGDRGLPPYLDDVPLEYFGEALAWLKGRPEVRPEAIGVLGASRGGELALILGATFPEVKAVVAQVPSGVVWAGWDPRRDGGAWTAGGHELPYMPDTGTSPLVFEDAQGRTIERDTPAFIAALDAASPEALDAATTRVEKATGPVLMLASADDAIWPSCRLAKIAMDRLEAAGHTAAFADDFVCYPGAGHHLGPPGLPTTDAAIVPQRRSDVWLALGGAPAGIARAARDAWARKRAFLAKALR